MLDNDERQRMIDELVYVRRSSMDDYTSSGLYEEIECVVRMYANKLSDEELQAELNEAKWL